MELSRRDAVAALAALGVGGAVAGAQHAGADEDDPPSSSVAADDEQVRAAMVAVAAVVYPSEVSGIEGFVNRFLDGRLGTDDHAARLRETVAELDGLARSWHGAPLAALSPATIDRLLGEVGADGVEERPDGTTPERVRYYVVNELLLALYASPTGGELVGLENPPGHPGGTASYTHGPT